MRRIGKELKNFDQRGMDRIMRQVLSGLKAESILEGKNQSLPAYFSDVSIKLFQPIHDLLPAATSREQHEIRHALRIAVKKWRYFFEVVAPVLGCDYGSIVGLLKEYQDILGCMNDVAVFGELCSSLELSSHERRFVEATLHAEDEHLLQKFIECSEQKPLAYSFRM